MPLLVTPVDTIYQIEMTINLSTWGGVCSLPSDRWAEIVRPLDFNQLQGWSFSQEDHSGAALLALLSIEASALPGDESQPDTIEQAMDRATIAEDLNETQLRIIAEHGN